MGETSENWDTLSNAQFEGIIDDIRYAALSADADFVTQKTDIACPVGIEPEGSKRSLNLQPCSFEGSTVAIRCCMTFAGETFRI